MWGGVKRSGGSNQMAWVCANKIGTIYLEFEEIGKMKFWSPKLIIYSHIQKILAKYSKKLLKRGGKKLFAG